MSDKTKKTIKINPELFKSGFSSSDKTRKNFTNTDRTTYNFHN